jgi:hypothetical protein
MPASRGRKVIPLSERPQDYFWIFVFSGAHTVCWRRLLGRRIVLTRQRACAVFTLTSVLYAPISAFNVRVSADSPHGIIRWMHSIAKETDTIIIDNPRASKRPPRPAARASERARTLFSQPH